MAHTHVSENNTVMTESGSNNTEILESEAISRVLKTEATSVSSPSSNYTVPNLYHSPSYYESPQKRTRLLR